MSSFCTFLVIAIFLGDANCASVPNFVVIFADDFGFDINTFGSPTTKTPNLDRLASQGMKLMQHYSGHSICSPSRAALMTSRYAIRTGIYSTETTPQPGTGDHRVVHPNCYGGLPHNETTVAELLKQQGYSTMMIGKWHLGYSYSKPDQLPTRHGFDVFYGTPYTHSEGPPNYPAVPLFSNETRIGRLGIDIDTSDLVFKYSEQAQMFIESQSAAGRSFLIYMALDNTHSEVYYPANFSGLTRKGPYGDATAALDWTVGQVIDTLTRLKLSDNTLVFFTSDNGAWYIPPPTEAGTVGPFQGTYAAHNLGYTDTGKGSTWEGGFRVPAIAWWPGKIVSGSVAENFTSSVDLLPTLLYYSGGAVPKDLIIDGQSISAVLEQTGNHSSTYSELKPFFYYRGPKLMATKMGAFKAHFITHSGFGHESFSYHDPPLLFNIEIDPQEREALSVKNYQDIVNDIIEAARSHNETVVPGTPQLDLIDYRAMDCNGLSQKQSGCCLEFGGKCST